ncbi:glycosyltransferase [Priestia megaterium]|uniref:glycosyltransferase n=1 Tax=Priestia megaterium TaxID=1404 RepID=UPI00345762E8
MNIIYLCNYMLNDVIEQRKNQNTFAQAANNKIKQIKGSLEHSGCRVTILSTAIVNNKSLKVFKGFKSRIEEDVFYLSTIDIPVLSTIATVFCGYQKIKKIHKENKLDYVIFWNYKPEVALTAFLCKKLLGIKIVVDYEDGYFALESISKVKKKIFGLVENLVSKHIDKAILISNELVKRINKAHSEYIVLPGLTNETVISYNKGRQKKNNNKVTLMYAGGLDHERGIDILISSLKYTEKDFDMYISGKGELVSMVKESTDKRINFLGFMEYEKTIEYMTNADILINPQKENQVFSKASFPSKIFDYVATDNLIISSNMSNMKGFSDGSFYIYENDDPRQLAKCIDKAIEDIKLNNVSKRLEGIVDIKNKYTSNNVGKKLKKLLS